MVIQEQHRLYTAIELGNLPDDGKRYELVRGDLLVMPLYKRLHSILTTHLITLLGTYIRAHDLGEITNECGYWLAENPDTVRTPDVAFTTKARIPPLIDEYDRIAPDLVVEVLSPGNTVDDMNDKIAEYFAAGVRQVWLFSAKNRTIHVYRSPKAIIVLDESDVLDGGDALPGFSVAVRDIFAVLPDKEKGK
ncbi:MAG: Uma2 family endonuclease [Aggregatilineales bacterium]